MKEIEPSLVENIIEEKASYFQRKIKDACKITNRTIHTEKSDFPIFRPANREFFEYKYYEGVLEWYIRDYLVTPILYELFKTMNIDVVLHPVDKRPNRANNSYEIATYGRDYPLTFIITQGNSSIGIRYSFFDCKDEEIMGIINDHNLSRIDIIDWSETDSLETNKRVYTTEKKVKERVHYVTLKRLFLDYFSEEVYKKFLEKICVAVEIANKEIGFQTIPNLSLRYLSDFKEATYKKLIGLSIESMRFRKFDEKGKPTEPEQYYSNLSDADIQIIQTNFASDGLMKAMISNEPFARCFITSEYLYSVFEKGNEKSFDYSAIATGYFKSVELLLMKIMNLAFGFKESKDLWIKTNHGVKPDDIDSIRYRHNPNNYRVIQVRFFKDYEKEFSTEMGPLIWFLHDWPNGWSISDNGRDLVHKCLLNYNQGCRNEHLHKDIIDDFKPVIESIRDNTILCLYYLLGGCKLTEKPDDRGTAFEIYSGDYNRLYKKLECKGGIPKSMNCFYIQFPGKEPVKAIRLHEQDEPENDDQGNQKSVIKFIIVDDFANIDYEELRSTMTKDNTIVISQENMPEKMWFHHPDKGRVEIKW